MFDYSFRCLETDYPEFEKFCLSLGLIEKVKGENGEVIQATNGGAWDYIGTAYDEQSGREELSAEKIVVKVDQTKLGDKGVPYIYINLRTKHNLEQKSVEVAKTDSKVATQLLSLNKFFVTDAEGKYVAPEKPLRVFL